MWFFKNKEKKEQALSYNDAVSYKHIVREFGEGFMFSSRSMKVDKGDIDDFTSGVRQNIDEKYNGTDIVLFESKKYRRILRLSLSIPTFDSGDREYDSRHDLYLLQENDRTLRAVYCTCGYRIAKVEGYARVYQIPEPLQKYFE